MNFRPFINSLLNSPFSGNVLSLAVALRPKVRGNSFSVFLGALAVADSLVLWAQAFLLITFYNVSPSFCASRPFLLMYPEGQANWIIAGTIALASDFPILVLLIGSVCTEILHIHNPLGLTLERAILITYPMKATSMGFGKQKSGFLFVGTLIFSVFLVHFPTLFFLEYDELTVI